MTLGESILSKFNQIDHKNMAVIDDLYCENCRFEDPLHSFTDRQTLKKYFEFQYQNVLSCRFEKISERQADDHLTLEWIMHLRHRALNRGKEFSLPGVSLLVLDPDKKILSHRDYFDVSQMLMEQIPLFGSVTRWVRKGIVRLGQAKS